METTTIKTAVDRRSQGYHKQRLSSVSELDKVASFLLASNYSSHRSQSKATQGLIHLDCVAVVQVNGSYWMASNSQGLDDQDAAELNGALEAVELDYEIIVRGSKNKMHAEMQLVEALKANNIPFEGVFMGVSKPCCVDCHHVLKTLKIQHTAFHHDRVLNWEGPNI